MNQKKIGGTKKKVTDALAMLLMIIVFCAFMFPFVMVIINSLKQKRDIIKSPFSWLFTIKGLSFDNFVKAFNQMNFLNAFKNSLVVTVTATVLVTVLAAMLAYYIVRNVNVFSNIIFALMVASMIIPFQAIMIPLVSVYGGTLNILNHRLTLIFMHTGFSMAMSVFMFHGFIRGSIPLALEEAAYIDGCTHTQTFFRIVFPLLKPIISTMVIMNAMAFWNDFLLPSLVLTDKKLLTKVVYCDHFDANSETEIVKKFKADFKAKYGTDVTLSFSATAYDAALVICQAILRAGSTDSCLEVSVSGESKCYTLPGEPEVASRIFSACQDGDMCAITGQFDDKNEKLIQFGKAERVAP